MNGDHYEKPVDDTSTPATVLDHVNALAVLRRDRTKGLQRTWGELGKYRGDTPDRRILLRRMENSVAYIRQLGEEIARLRAAHT